MLSKVRGENHDLGRDEADNWVTTLDWIFYTTVVEADSPALAREEAQPSAERSGSGQFTLDSKGVITGGELREDRI